MKTPIESDFKIIKFMRPLADQLDPDKEIIFLVDRNSPEAIAMATEHQDTMEKAAVSLLKWEQKFMQSYQSELSEYVTDGSTEPRKHLFAILAKYDRQLEKRWKKGPLDWYLPWPKTWLVQLFNDEFPRWEERYAAFRSAERASLDEEIRQYHKARKAAGDPAYW